MNKPRSLASRGSEMERTAHSPSSVANKSYHKSLRFTRVIYAWRSSASYYSLTQNRVLERGGKVQVTKWHTCTSDLIAVIWDSSSEDTSGRRCLLQLVSLLGRILHTLSCPVLPRIAGGCMQVLWETYRSMSYTGMHFLNRCSCCFGIDGDKQN